MNQFLLLQLQRWRILFSDNLSNSAVLVSPVFHVFSKELLTWPTSPCKNTKVGRFAWFDIVWHRHASEYNRLKNYFLYSTNLSMNKFVQHIDRSCVFKGIVHQFFFYCSNLIFWVVMGCGIADFGRRVLKTPTTQHFWIFILSPGTSTRGATRDLDSRRRGPRLAAQGTLTRGAIGPWLKSMAPRVEVLCGAASRGPWGQNKNPKMLSFGRL